MKKILVGISGGSDSMYLIETLISQKYEIIACHVNYNKRKTAKRDQKIVEDYCKKKNIKLEILLVTEKVYNKYKKHKNFQNQARQIRYDFFNKIAIENNCNNLYVGHHKDDFIETAIMQENRSSDYLFYGIKNKGKFKNLEIHRPLFKLWKSKIENDLKDRSIKYGIDESNFQDKYERNKIRIELSKKTLKQKNEIYNYFLKINKSNEIINRKVDKHFNNWLSSEFDIEYYRQISDKLKTHIIYKWLTSIDDIKINKNKLNDIVIFLKNSNSSKKYRISENISITIKNKKLIIV